MKSRYRLIFTDFSLYAHVQLSYTHRGLVIIRVFGWIVLNTVQSRVAHLLRNLLYILIR